MAVFLSHSRKDKSLEVFRLLLEDLALMRVDYWIDERLGGGQPWWDEILLQIRESELVLIALSPKSLKSQACRREWSYAEAVNRLLLPVAVAEVPSWQVPESIAQHQILDYTKRSSSEAGVTTAMRLRDAIEGLRSKESPLPEPLPTPPDVPTSYLAEIQPFLDQKDLSYSEQERFLVEVRQHLDVEDDDRQVLIGALSQFRSRPDVAVRVANELDEMIARIGGTRSGTLTPKPGKPRQEPRVSPEAGDQDESPTEVENPTFVASKVSHFDAPGLDLEWMASHLVDWYEGQNLEAQWDRNGERYVVQCRDRRSWVRWTGAGAALTVVLGLDDHELTVEIGGAKWIDKVAAGGVATFLLWPAAIPAAVGGYRQATLPKRTLEEVGRQVARLVDSG